MPAEAALLPHPMTPFAYWGKTPPYVRHGFRVLPVDVEVGVTAARARVLIHLVTHAGVMERRDGTLLFGARWFCGGAAKDVAFVDRVDPLCERCESAAKGPCVYRCFDAEGALLYVGSTSDRHTRMNAHAKRSHWWAGVSRVAYENFADVGAAQAAETSAIYIEDPLHNKIGRRRFNREAS